MSAPGVIILNIGCGQEYIEGAINIDIDPQSKADMPLDMSYLPWIWQEEFVDKIIMHHFLEHTKNPHEILSECHRVLKKDGVLEITVPHSSSIIGIGCFTHYRTFSFNSLKDYFGKTKLFKTIHQRIVWQPHHLLNPIQFLIDLSPRLFERFWCYYVGGATQVEWIGRKI